MRESDFDDQHLPRHEAESPTASNGDPAQLEQTRYEFELRLVLAALRVGLAREGQADRYKTRR